MAEYDIVTSGVIDAKHSALARDNGVSIAVGLSKVDYLQPARLDEYLHIFTPNTAHGSTTMWTNKSSTSGAKLARLTVRIGCIGPTRRVVRFPKVLRAAFERFYTADPLLAREGA